MENEDKILDKITDPYYTDYTMITEYIIPVGKTIIGSNVFSHCCDLEKLYIPWYVEKIPESNFRDKGKGPFWHYYQTNLIICGEKSTAAEWCAKEAGVRFFETAMWIQDNRLEAYFGRSESAIIPEGKGIDTIRHNAFQYAPQVVSVEIPNTVKHIGSEAFRGCELKEVCIPFGVIGLGSRVFKNCKNLQCVVFENGDTKLDNDCFLGCSDTLVIKAPSGGYVEKYAQKYQVKFESI